MPKPATAHKSHKPKVRISQDSPDWYTLGDLSFPTQERAQQVAEAVVKATGQPGEASTEGSEQEPTWIC